MYSYAVEQAIRAAAVLHADQVRKGSVPIPYISHLVSVVMTLRDYTTDENTLVAAFLHDTIEDTDYTYDEMKEDFGGHVADIVLTLTEPVGKNGEELSKFDKKKAYVKQLKNAPQEALMIAAADKAHNFRSMIEEYHDDHDRFRQDFGSTLDERLHGYTAISNVLNAKLKNDIVHEFNHTFEEYKKFLSDVQKSAEKEL